MKGEMRIFKSYAPIIFVSLVLVASYCMFIRKNRDDTHRLPNPKDINFAHYFKLTELWADATIQVIRGAELLDNLEKPLVTILGGHLLNMRNIYYQQAYQVAQELARRGCAIVTGGNEGIMEAANCGAALQSESIASIAIRVKDVGKENRCAQQRITIDNFFARKWLLMNYACAVIIFPGGMGTLAELSELLTLIATKKIAPIPIYMVGTHYWKEFKLWLMQEAVKEQLISVPTISLVHFTDSIEEIIDGIMNFINLYVKENS